MQGVPTLLRELKKFYAAHGRRHLPWRATRDPYKILVSEVMLQQTQVDRAIPFYTEFTRRFPTAKKLAAATLPSVLKTWQGLGYNRRAKHLHEAAKILSEAKTFRGGARHISPERDVFAKLPGVGPYTRGAVLAFAYNQPEIFVETNIRTVLFHSHILKKVRMSDKELLPIVEELLKKSKMEPREFYAAMMDYGAYLKKQGIKLNYRSAHYQKQSRFEGSRRQARAAKLRQALRRGASAKELEKILTSK
jgi:A/G-specific adenine glycosylase